MAQSAMLQRYLAVSPEKEGDVKGKNETDES